MTSLFTGVTFILWGLSLLGIIAISATVLGIFALVTGILWIVAGVGVELPVIHRNRA